MAAQNGQLRIESERLHTDGHIPANTVYAGLRPVGRPRTISWSELSDISFLRNGTGTSLYLATLAPVALGDGQSMRVVIKMPKWGISPDEMREVSEEIEHETEMLQRLNHPNIIKVQGTGRAPLRDEREVGFMAVRFLDGGILSDRLNTTSPAQVAGADAAHRKKAKAAMEALAPPQPATSSQASIAEPVPMHGGSPINIRMGSSRGNSMTSGPASSRGAERPPSPASWVKRMSYAETLRCAEELADALRYLHDEADANKIILHRDLKPDNVGFLAEGSLQLFDFGLATSVPRQPSSSSDPQGGDSSSSAGEGGGGGSVGLGSGVVLPRYRMTGHTGSVRYMAPEVATDMPYNQAVDTYSFAMILWEMVHRKKPFSGMDVETHRTAVCVQGVRPPLDKKLAPADLVTLLQAAWSADADHRPPFRRLVPVLASMRETAESEASKRAGAGGGSLRQRFLSFGKSSSSSWF